MNQAKSPNTWPCPIRPLSVVRLCRLWPHARKWGHEIGQSFRVGYYSRKDGLDCVWLVDGQGKYDWTVDHTFLRKHFELIAPSRETSFFGANRPLIGPLVSVP